MQSEITSSPWLSPEQAAQYLGVGRRTLLEWARIGHVKGYTLHGTKRHVWRFRQSDLDAMFRQVDACAMLDAPAVLKTEGRIQ